MQLLAAVLGGANETATIASASNVTTTLLSPVNNKNATAAATTTTTGMSTQLKIVQTEGNIASVKETVKEKESHVDKVDNSTVITRKVSNTATMQSATSAKPTTTTSTTTTTTTTTQTPQAISSSPTKATTTVITNNQAKITTKSDKPLAEGVSQSDINNSSNSKGIKTTPATVANSNVTSSSNNSSSTSSSSSTTTSTTTTSTTTTTTMRPMKPNITRSMDVPIAGEKVELNSSIIGSAKVDNSIRTDPITQPVQEMVTLPNSQNDYVVPIVTIMFTVPVAIFVFILMYRRFRDLWHTRHYRRMDFLVDGMYND